MGRMGLHAVFGSILVLGTVCLAGVTTPARAAETDVTIYRCTDAKGKLTLRDTPCAKGQKQETRSMLRPTDASASPVRPPSAPRAAPPPPTRVVIVNAPRPLYECVTPDGDRYTSDSDAGNPRFVPLWTLGVPVLVRAPVFTPGSARVDVRDGHVDARFRSGSLHHAVVPTAAAYGAGTWVHDQCHALPQAEVCDRLLDRRSEIRRRFFNAMPSERDVLRTEERGINARLGSDCGVG